MQKRGDCGCLLGKAGGKDRTEPPSGVPMLAQNNFGNFGEVLDGLDGSSLGSPDKSPIIPTQTAVGSLSRCLLTNHRTTIFLSFK